ncbi:DUF2163 domain-containing protein [Pelagovum pacificum]|uniref:DUF2163 domain-containing protein n=1 Tax=Pelagovum pacificum TaxID=2588711 RepID=A0A5C5GD93_9RHOB|nr:DUF2163 domain-containing protein [Pelagovum pacificum]QQA41233.1 DUF2163 domain-containing protein [Pelagovum pacificum]TNY31959.1 DUF2163 domain-containing protein [Pelagovum pacificum]
MTLASHLVTGLTTVCRCWSVLRADGVLFGFTDHDRPVSFDGMTFRADTGLTARQTVRTTGLSVDNSEALGVLSDDAVTESDIEAGRFDGAEVTGWLVNWRAPAERQVTFRGHIGDIRRGGGAFHAELRGLAEALNHPVGRSFQPTCDAVLGDRACGLDLSPLSDTDTVAEVFENRVIRLADTGRPPGWYALGRLAVLSGAAAGLSAVVKDDAIEGTERVLGLWEPLRATLTLGDTVRVEPGCDKSDATCRTKFSNFINFRGFPHVPGEDWLAAVPRLDGTNDGGRRT